MTLYFENRIGEKALAKIVMVNNMPVSEWQVIIYSVPDSDEGQEITVNFYSFDIDN